MAPGLFAPGIADDGTNSCDAASLFDARVR